ncbi:MAG: substrate-binding domain-containing protein, partial [bacterium]|nr:substrate-binding domain-containing protein [bacterium]
SHENNEKEGLNIKAMIANRVDGLMISISQNTKNKEPFLSLKRQKIPFVFFDRVFNDNNLKTSVVVVNDLEGSQNAVEYLIKKGYRRIAHLAGPEYIAISHERHQGYKNALKKHNIPYDSQLVIHGGFNEEDGIIGFQKLLKLDKMPDAIFAVNDPVAIGAFMQIKQNGLKIPDDIALVGFSDNPVMSLIEPAVTTVKQPMYEIGQVAAKLLLEQIENDQDTFKPREEVLKTELIIRNST